jgi:RimJ/RimL family protein N-acetyltransferase
MMQLKLKTLKPSDKTKMAILANNKKIWGNVRDGFGHPYSEKNAEDFIGRQANNDTEKVFAIEFDGELCGLVGLIFQKDIYRKSAEIGYWIGQPYWGQGIATKAVGLLVDHAFDELAMARLYAGVFEYNIGSMRVLEKNGFLKEGILKKAVFKNGKFWNEHRYAKLRE